LTPSQAEDIDFETRLASYSDDELNSLNTNMRKQSKDERRRSKDDAWVDILVSSQTRRAPNQDAEVRRPTGPRLRNASRPDPEDVSQEIAQVLAGIRGPSPPFDGDSEADIEPMKVPHRSRMVDHGTMPLDDIYEPSEGQTEREEVDEREEELMFQSQQHASRRVGYFDLHPDRRRPMHMDGDEILPELDILAPVDNEVEPPRRSDVTTTESVYSSSGNNTPPASPKRAVPDLRRLEVPTSAHPQPPSPQAQPTPSPQTPTYSPRDLQRQQEVRDRLSGKPGPKAATLIEMYRERERQGQATTGGGAGSRSSASGVKSAQTAKESTALPPPPPPPPPSAPAPSSSEPETEPELMSPEPSVAGDKAEISMEPPNVEFESGRESPFRYVHGAPLHNVVEEEEE